MRGIAKENYQISGVTVKMDCVNFDRMPCVYWNNVTKISYLQRQVIVHSILYYHMDASCVSDRYFDGMSTQLVQMQKNDMDSLKASQYYYMMHDFDGTTGFDLYDRLTDGDKKYLTKVAANVLRNVKSGM